ncbi:MAG: Glycerol-3-phosphate dehydrogenase [NAD(P)+] [Chlamydiae bacterium]|nr:Glycerol-3-phosphate dehydrogenase [NAD(P)+] [Chlamydiota bacterium]
MKIGYLGAGAWGSCLARLLSEKGYEVKQWIGTMTLEEVVKREREHFQDHRSSENRIFTSDLKEAIVGADIIIESVTSKGLRPVLNQIVESNLLGPPLILTSKGIEQDTGLLLSEVAIDVLGERYKNRIGSLSGPSLANEVNRKLPTSVVGSSYDHDLMMLICEIFTTPYFRVYPNEDMAAISFGGAMKNIIAIACAISDGLGFGENTKAALMTRGLHEIRKLGAVKGCSPETLNGLSGLGDLCATCLSKSSRNYKFGYLLAKGHTPDQAIEEIGMVVEGAYTCVSARQLAHKHGIDLPITEAVYSIIYEGTNAREAVEALLTRSVKQEHL